MTTPGFGYASNDDNTGRGWNYDYQAPVYAASLAITTVARETYVQIALTGALTLTAGVGTATTPPKFGDKLIFDFSNDANTRVVTFSTGLSFVTSTLSNTASKLSHIEFQFNGTTWVEVVRSTTA